jgi:hypothetical protein
MPKFRFNPEAFKLLAKELRRASWGAAAAIFAMGYAISNGLSIAGGIFTWIFLQVMAFALESVEKGD